MDCPICDKISAFEQYGDICDICEWEADPFMSNEEGMRIQFLDCDGNRVADPGNIPSPNHCKCISEAREAWSKWKTKNHFDKDNAPSGRDEVNRMFKHIFGKNFKES
jgi:hypothetical protein